MRIKPAWKTRASATNRRSAENFASIKRGVLIGGRGFLAAGFVTLAPVFLFATLFALQFLCLFLLLIIIGSRIYTEYLVRHIKVIRRDKELREFRRQWVTVELIVENQGIIPAFMLAISDSPGILTLVHENKLACALPAGSRKAHSWKGFCSERGVFFIGPASIRGSDPLGLFPFQIICADIAKLFVYPQPCVSGIKPSGGVPLGVLLSRNPLHEDLSRTRSLRPYQIGDEPRRINWKASAKSSGADAFSLIVNEYEATVSYPFTVFLNLDIHQYPSLKGHFFIERAIEAAAALCRESSERRQNTGIIIFSGGRPEKIDIITQSRFALIPILEQLALFQQGNRQDTPTAGENNRCVNTLLERAKQMPQGTRIMYVGPDLEYDAYMSLSVMRKFHLSIEYLIIDEKSVSALAPGNMKRYQMKEMGYAII